MSDSTVAKRFALGFTRGQPDECWEWQKGRQKAGYGAINDRGKVLATHRVAWELANGPIPEGMHVLHRCDNPPCVNDGHLFLGTPKDNDTDKRKKGRANHRGMKGEAHPMTKLTDDDVRAIRASVGTEREVAEKYGVSGTCIGYIRRRQTWKHVPDTPH